MDVNANKYTAAQLRCWLQHLNMPTAGTKNTLVLRLNEIPANERGECPIDSISSAANAVGETNESVEGDSETEEAQVNLNKQTSENEVVQIRDDDQTSDNRIENMSESAQMNVQTERNTNWGGNEFMLMKRELELVKREKELLLKENAFLKKKEEYEKNQMSVNTNRVSINDVINNDENVENDLVNNNNINSGNNNANVSFGLLKDLLPEYDGVTCPEIWISQIKNIATMYAVDDSTLKALLMTKVKGKAQVWLHSKSNYVYEKLENLFEEIVDLFSSKENKLVMRRNFEACKWQYNAAFIDYFNEKIILANKVGVCEEELIDYLIEGIPDDNLKIHANLQCYKTKTQLLQAFSKIQLKEPVTTKTTLKSETKLRCFNCNSMGHFAADCRKPKREVGACFACGSREHRVAACPERKVVQKIREAP